MSIFKEIVNEALLTEISQNREDDIKKAINNVLRVRISYNDKKGGKGKNERYILPVAFGLTKSGKKAIRAYQTAGSSKRGLTTPPNNRKFPKWKLFLMDNIYSWSNGKKSFKEYKDALIRQGLNTQGDKGMTTLYAITPFADSDVEVAKDSQQIKSTPVTKMDVAPTADSQNRETTDAKTFEPAKVSRGQVDNTKQSNYFDNKVEAPDTEPITKTQVSGQEENPQQSNQPEKLDAPETKPVEKTDINNADEKEKVKADFNNLMDRMDNLYNDDEEENED